MNSNSRFQFSNQFWPLLYGGLVLTIIVLAISLRAFPLFHYVEFYYDQARDAFVLQQALAGNWPTLGPSASVSAFSLPPQYYYAMLPFAALGPWPQLHLLVNTLACLFGIGLIYLVCYHWLLQSLSRRSRQLLALLASLFIAVGYWYFGLSIGVWNPNPLPLAVLGLTCSFYAIQKDLPLKIKNRQLSQLSWWAIAGICLGFSMGLHSTALFVLPLWAMLFCGYWLYKNKISQWPGPAILALTAIIIHIPYLIGQFTSNWQNTSAIISYLGQSSSSTLLERLGRAIDYNFTLIQAALMPQLTQPAIIGLLATLLLLAGGYAFFKLNKTLAILIIAPWLLFIIFGSGYQDTIHHHYILIGYWLPTLLLVSLIGYSFIVSKNNPPIRNIVVTSLALLLVGSLTLNTFYTAKAIKTDLTTDHRISVVQKRDIINELPSNTTICSYYGQDYTDLDYLNVYITKRQDIRFIQDCQPGYLTLYIQDLNKRQADKPFNPDLPVIQQTSNYTLQLVD